MSKSVMPANVASGAVEVTEAPAAVTSTVHCQPPDTPVTGVAPRISVSEIAVAGTCAVAELPFANGAPDFAWNVTTTSTEASGADAATGKPVPRIVNGPDRNPTNSSGSIDVTAMGVAGGALSSSWHDVVTSEMTAAPSSPSPRYLVLMSTG